ncbi:MAG: NADH-ubiquinone oxidoreductase-F iron-sulfur binding region domain-containing protein [Rubrivivax sp.]|nr:NADH-ubiquinone oxidoreductase-F iron-sulfur binding region domain-containing protein [Rubrivivax sp.]
MDRSMIPIASAESVRLRKRQQTKGRQVDVAVRAEVQGWLGAEPLRRDRLIEYLHLINDRQSCLPAPHLAALAQLMRLSQAEVFEVASFYHHFAVVKEGANGQLPAAPALTVRVCDGLPCEMAGARELLARLPALLGGAVRVIAAPCVGRCETAPVAVVGQYPVPHATLPAVQAAVADGRTTDIVQGHIGFDAYRALGGYALLVECHQGQRSADSLIETLEHAGLRGLGGAGFPAGRKWRIVREQPAPRLMAVNIDEGEPGTFKDRWLLERDPHRFLEGMLVAAWAVGVSAIVIYLRDEYHACRAMLSAELDRLRADPPVHGLPTIELRRGAGAYICGEESAMIESIEGRRGLPRLRPPYVAEFGLHGRPTLVHNIETLYWVREIVERGAPWFASHGRHGRQGLRSFSVSGRVAEPGVKRAPAGITLRELVDEHCGGMQPGHELYAYLPGGASGGILPARLADLPLDFDTLQPHGCFIGSAAVIVLSQHDRALDAARNVMRFFAHESCGQCTPCRAGTAKASALMAQPVWDVPLLTDLSQVMRDASICGLGQAAPTVMDGVLKHFAHEVQR